MKRGAGRDGLLYACCKSHVWRALLATMPPKGKPTGNHPRPGEATPCTKKQRRRGFLHYTLCDLVHIIHWGGGASSNQTHRPIIAVSAVADASFHVPEPLNWAVMPAPTKQEILRAGAQQLTNREGGGAVPQHTARGITAPMRTLGLPSGVPLRLFFHNCRKHTHDEDRKQEQSK